MEITRLLSIAIVVLVLLNAVLVAVIFRNTPERREEPRHFVIKVLELDRDQQLRYEQLIYQHRQQADKLRQEVNQLQRSLVELLKTSQPDLEKADSITALIAAHRKEVEMSNFRHFSDIRALCRPEQQEKFDALVEQIAAKFRPPPPPGRP